MSFFVDLLVAIVFPVLAGLLLGLWIYLWRKVHSIFIKQGIRNKEDVVIKKKDSDRNKERTGGILDQKAKRPHRQLLVGAETDVLY